MDDKYRLDNLMIREFVTKTMMRVVIMLLIIAPLWILTQTPILTNEIAMHQMENSNEWFVTMTAYQKFAYVAGTFMNVFVVVTLGFIGWDGYKLAKTLTSETNTENKNEKEKEN